MTTPAPHVQRLQAELSELQDRLQKLNAFRESDKFQQLDTHNQNLLHRQALIMTDYVAVLQERLALAGAV